MVFILKLQRKTYCLVFLFHSSYLSILVKILFKITIELSYNREVYFFLFISSSNQHSASLSLHEKWRTNWAGSGELNYPSCFPASRFQFLILPTQLICHALSIHKVVFTSFNFEFSLEILFSVPCCINNSMPLQSLYGTSLCVNNFCPGHEKNLL